MRVPLFDCGIVMTLRPAFDSVEVVYLILVFDEESWSVDSVNYESMELSLFEGIG